MIKRLLVISLILVNFSCNDEDDRFETLTKLRTIGVSSTPVFPKASTLELEQVVTLDFYATVPLGSDVNVDPYTDPSWSGVTPVTLTFADAAEPYKDYAKLRRFAGKATFTVPKKEELFFNPKTGYAKIVYGIKLTSGEEVEKVIGSILVYKDDAGELANYKDTPLSVSITTPEKAATGDTDLTAATGNVAGGEGIKIGWFVSTGKVVNRRAKTTTWKDAEKGQQTIIVTGRGVKSGAFSMDIRDVTIN